MIGIAQIWLTVSAWKKGWGPLALIPLGVTLFVAFLLGGSVQSEADLTNLTPLLVLGDLLCVAVLWGMARKGPIVVDTANEPECAPAETQALPSASC